MSKNKLKKFEELKKFPNVFQYPYNFLQEEKLDIKGKWCEFFKNDYPIILELGCGKGEYTIALAKIFPEKNFIGVDIKGARIYSGAKRALIENSNNVAFLRTHIELINHFFLQGEISEIWLTFPDPQMKKTNKRLTSTRFMQYYSNLLCDNGIIHLKTDSWFLFNYTCEMIKANKLSILLQTDDLYKDYPIDKILSIRTFYEQQWFDRGLKIKYIRFICQRKENYVEPKVEIEPDTYRSFNRNRVCQKDFFTIQKVVPRIHKSPFLHPLSWKVNKGEIWSIIGSNGSGKTLFAEIIAGKHNLIEGEINYSFKEQPEKAIRIISFESVYLLTDFREFYYQQRFNHTETDNLPTVADLFHSEQIKQIGQIFDIEKLKFRKLIHLSSGELRKFLITRILLEYPRMIIFDNPFIGLDIHSKQQLDEIFYSLSKKGIQLVFLIPSVNDMPSLTSHVLKMERGISSIYKITEWKPQKINIKENIFVDWNLFSRSIFEDSEIVVKMENVDISYKKQIVIQGINWEIKQGEKWALLGANGSGKSTLISYIFADNPISYTKRLILFDRQRGTGESIWDIKQRIGFTSSEMHLYYRQNVNCRQVIESGFFDSIGLWQKCTPQQIAIVEYLFDLFCINYLKESSFLRISSGEQRLILFARSLVKNPELLILDEPFHGLDDKNKHLCLQIVESYAMQPNKSLIFVTHQLDEIPPSVKLFFRL